MRDGRSNDPTFAAFFRAQQINLAAGGAVIAPWEVHLLDEEWIEAARLLCVEYPKRQRVKAAGDQAATAWRNNHPAYKKRR